MSWSSSLATTAQNYADTCTSSTGVLLDHNPNRGTDVGENIYATTGGPVRIKKQFISIFELKTIYFKSKRIQLQQQMLGMPNLQIMFIQIIIVMERHTMLIPIQVKFIFFKKKFAS